MRKGSFQRADQTEHEPHQPSRAEAAGINPPPLNEKQKQGLAVEAALAAGRVDAQFELQARYETEKAEYEKARDDAVMKRVEARRNVKL
jgi:hypothetical protein